MKKRSSTKSFKTTREMDDYLESHDLATTFRKSGVPMRPSPQRINLDLPRSVLAQIDIISKKIGVSRQPLLKLWIHERLKQEIKENA